MEKFFKGLLTNLITVLFTTVNGQKMVIEMAKEHKFGKMEVNLLAIGEMTKPMERVD